MELIGRRGDDEKPISVERTGSLYRVRVGEAVYEVDATTAGGDGLLSLRVTGDGHFEVAVAATGNGGYRVSTRHGTSDVELLAPLAHLARQAARAAGGSRPARVTAYMPGRVVALLVEEGAEVKAGQGVVVLEAMKMENEIQAESDGVVKRLFVEAGQSVDGGEPLFEIG